MSIVRVQPIAQGRIDFADFCRLPNTLIGMGGQDLIDSQRPLWQKVILKLYMAASSLSQLYCLYYISKEVFSMLSEGITDLALFLRLLSGFNYAVFGTVKFVSFHWNLAGMQDIKEKLKVIYPDSCKEQRLYRTHEYFWPKWIRSTVYLYVGAVTFIALSPLAEAIIMYMIDVIHRGSGEAQFGYYKLYDIRYGFDHRHPLAYIVTYTIEILHAIFIVIWNISGDIWLLCYTMQLCMHFEYLLRTMEQYEPDDEAYQKDQQFIADFVRKHQILLK